MMYVSARLYYGLILGLISSTFSGSISSILQYSYTGKEQTLDRLFLRLKSRRINTVLFYLTNAAHDYFLVQINSDGMLTSVYDWAGEMSETQVLIDNEVIDADWHNVTVMLPANVNTMSRLAVYVGGIPDNHNVPSVGSRSQPYKGCLDEVRLGELLLPVYPDELLQDNNLIVDRFLLSDASTSRSGCHGDDMCATDECVNDARCDDLWNDYQCVCVPGYNGTFCEYDIDECVGHLCLHGECVDGVNEYDCNCTPGYTDLL